MTSPKANFSDEFLITSFAHISRAHVDAAFFVPLTGLLALSLFKERRLLLGIGLGPVVTQIGFLPQMPLARTNQDHPLVAALRAHLVGLTIRNVSVEDDVFCITAESADFPSRLFLHPGRQGKARLLTANGITFEWPSPTNSLVQNLPLEMDLDLEAQGRHLLHQHDSFCIDALRRDLLTNVRKRIQRLERRMAAVRQDLARLAEVPRLQKIGSLLLSQGKTIPRGAERATLMDWETNAEVVVNLVPDKPAQSQASEFFQKARRLQRGAEVMQKRLDDTVQMLAVVKPWQEMIQDAPADWNTLQEIAKQASDQGLGIAVSPAVLPTKQKKSEGRKPYHTFYSASNREIWVGKSGKDNDKLVTRLARPHDLWLHAKNMTGAHVIVPLEKNHSCPPEVLVDAATLAAHFSSARHESRCEVSYVEKRYVRKPRKSAPGSVMTHGEKVIDVRIEKDRLSRLLGSKLETP